MVFKELGEQVSSSESVKKCLSPFLKFATTFRLFIIQIPFKYCQKIFKKQILNIKKNAIPNGIFKVSFAPKRDQRQSKFDKKILDISTLKIPKLIYLCRLVETLQRIKVRVLQKFEDVYIETFIQIHSFDDAKNLQNSVVPSL